MNLSSRAPIIITMGLAVVLFILALGHRSSGQIDDEIRGESMPKHSTIWNQTTTAASFHKEETALETTNEEECPSSIDNSSSLLLPQGIALSSKVTFMHVGKAGGGTIYVERRSLWKLRMARCHPKPCDKSKMDNMTLIINVRDPIDRFVSAFYFTHARFCNPDLSKETRTVEHIGSKKQRYLVTDHEMETTCLVKPDDPAAEIFYIHYQENVNNLAEALCSEKPRTRKNAMKQLASIHHMGSNLDNWMTHTYFWPKRNNSDKIFPIVMAPIKNKNNTLEHQTDQAMEWLYEKLQFESPQDFEARQRAVRCPAEDKKNNNYQHSSHSTSYAPLSDKFEPCLAKFYWKDYLWLARIGSELCKTRVCQEAINAILQRREMHFDTKVWEDHSSAELVSSEPVHRL